MSLTNTNGTESESGYPSGHIGHLSPDQEIILQEFKRCCSEKGYYTPASNSTTASHDDATLLRFLRARCFDVPSAVDQFASNVDWRKKNDLDNLYECMDVKFFEETRFLYPQWTGRCDRRGIPIFLYDVKQLSPDAMASYDDLSKKSKSKVSVEGIKISKFSRLFALYEDMVKFVMPLCTAVTNRKYQDTPITQCCNLVDVSGVGLRQFWNLREHMLDASALASAHYPETLDRIIIIGTPSFFPMVWGWIQKWFDANTTSKILILGGPDMLEKLSLIIEPQNIPKKYGGQLNFQSGDKPQIDEAIKEIVTWEKGWTDFPLSPMRWLDNGDTMEGYAVGSISGLERREKICTINKSSVTAL
ncbi:hypothetical protein EPUL_001832, partial [Erysiphe pulchra]